MASKIAILGSIFGSVLGSVLGVVLGPVLGVVYGWFQWKAGYAETCVLPRKTAVLRRICGSGKCRFGVHFGGHFGVHFGVNFGTHFGYRFGIHFGVRFGAVVGGFSDQQLILFGVVF